MSWSTGAWGTKAWSASDAVAPITANNSAGWATREQKSYQYKYKKEPELTPAAVQENAQSITAAVSLDDTTTDKVAQLKTDGAVVALLTRIQQQIDADLAEANRLQQLEDDAVMLAIAALM